MSESNPRMWAIQHPDLANAKVGDEVTIRPVTLGPTKMTPEERAEKREAVIQGLMEKGHSRERAEELIALITGALFAPGKRFGRPTPPGGDRP